MASSKMASSKMASSKMTAAVAPPSQMTAALIEEWLLEDSASFRSLFARPDHPFQTEMARLAEQIQVSVLNGGTFTGEKLALLSKNPAFANVGGVPKFLKFTNHVSDILDYSIYYEANPGPMQNGLTGGEAFALGNIFIKGLLNLFCNPHILENFGIHIQKFAKQICKLEYQFAMTALENKSFNEEEIRFQNIYKNLLSSDINRKIGLRCQAYELNDKGQPVACYSFAVAHCQPIIFFDTLQVLYVISKDDADFYFSTMKSMITKHADKYTGKYQFIY